jgi:hypothetical protein
MLPWNAHNPLCPLEMPTFLDFFCISRGKFEKSTKKALKRDGFYPFLNLKIEKIHFFRLRNESTKIVKFKENEKFKRKLFIGRGKNQPMFSFCRPLITARYSTEFPKELLRRVHNFHIFCNLSKTFIISRCTPCLRDSKIFCMQPKPVNRNDNPLHDRILWAFIIYSFGSVNMIKVKTSVQESTNDL